MADVKGLLADPEFQKLDSVTQKSVLGRVDPAFSGLSDGDFQSFVQRMQPAPQPKGQTYTTRSGDQRYLPTNAELGPVMGGPVVPGGLGAIIPMAAGYGVQSGADALGAPPWLSGAAGMAASLLTGGAGASPKLQAFARGAGRAVPEAVAGGSPMMTLTSRAVKSIPSIIKGGTTTAEGHPWVPKFLTDMFAVPPEYSGNPSTPGLSNVESIAPPPRGMTDDEIAFENSPKVFRPNSAPRNIPPISEPPSTAEKGPVWHMVRNANGSMVPTLEPVPAEVTITGRKPGGIQNQQPLEAKVSPPPVDDLPSVEEIARSMGAKGKLTPADRLSAQKVQDSLRAAVKPPPSFKPDIESKVVATDGPVQPGKFEATLKGHQSAKAQKIQNIHDYLTTAKHDYTPEKLVQMDQASPGKLSPAKQTFLKDAYDWSKANNRPVPKNGYTSLNLQETRPGYEGQGTLQDVLDLMQGKEINPMHMPIKDPFGWGK